MVAVVGVMAFFAAPAEAQRTGDHIVPSIETVCDGDPFSFGLCNAYCESHDCDSPTPIGTPRACSNILRNYKKKSGGAVPPCSCPCQFAVAGDLALLEEAAEADIPPGDVDIDVLGTLDDACGANVGPNGEAGYLAEAWEFGGPGDGQQGIRLAYWLTGDAEEGGTCNKLGVGLDGLSDIHPDFSYGPYIEIEETLTGGLFQSCQGVLDFICEQVEQPE
jgi:hypothetical protein